MIEQTFGIGSDDRQNQIFNDLPTPKSRMKREIDIENEPGERDKHVAAGQHQQISSGQNNRKKIFEGDNVKRQSEQ